MKGLRLAAPGERLSILCLGAHSDDIEIGAGGTILSLIVSGIRLDVTWCVLSAINGRADEALASARKFLKGAEEYRVQLGSFEDTYFPDQSRSIKQWLAELSHRVAPDIIFTHRGDDAHQDHREISRLTWNVFRDHTILEYEIPKWDGDLGQPNVYMPLSQVAMDAKVELLLECFGSQRAKDWFDAETFRSLARLRGMECRAEERWAEAFTMRKLLLA